VLDRVSDEVLKRTLEKRLKTPHGPTPRPGPAILAMIADAALLDELISRRPHKHAARLEARFAPLLGAWNGETPVQIDVGAGLKPAPTAVNVGALPLAM